jgi:hypothetical protein
MWGWEFPVRARLRYGEQACGAVARSSSVIVAMASSALRPHMSGEGRRLLHTAGRSGLPNSLQRLSSVSWTQRTPAGLPCGIPGMGDEIDGAMQHAPQPARQFMVFMAGEHQARPYVNISLHTMYGRNSSSSCCFCERG